MPGGRSKGGLQSSIVRRIRMRRRDCRIRNLRFIRGWTLRAIAADCACSVGAVANVLRRQFQVREIPIARRPALLTSAPLLPTPGKPDLGDRAAAGQRLRDSMQRCPRCQGALYDSKSQQFRFHAISYDTRCLACGRCPLPPVIRQPDVEDMPTSVRGRGRPPKWH